MKDADDKPPLDEDELLGVLRNERARAVGFDNDGELTTDRRLALEYMRGVMNDMPSLENRSAATTTDIADAVRTLEPDLLDIFTGGDDIATFIPHGPEDEASAKQETDYLKNVIFQQNDGFHTVYTMIHDALVSKVGVCTYYWEDYEGEEEVLEGKTQEEAMAIHLQATPAPQPGQKPPAPPFEIVEVTKGEAPDTYDLTIKKPDSGKICIRPIPPEDFAVSQDTIRLPDATWCAMRSRPRVQALIADGYDPKDVRDLPAYGMNRDDATQSARDTAGEFLNGQADNPSNDLRQVEIVEHYIRLPGKGKKLDIWRVVTGAGETKLLASEKVQRIQFAAITPYVVTHRFYGESVADLLLNHQRQSTAVMRAWLDSIYFALNQRAEISEQQASENTVSDFLRNEPGVPIRSKTGVAVREIVAGAPNIDLMGAMEYLNTVSEKKTGVVRATQGLNPDTLHDTAKGALTLMAASLRRMRLIARVFAETGFKDLYLGVHALIREHSTQADQRRLNGQWVSIDPSTWGERADMSIEIGLGSGGKDQAIAMLLQQIEAAQKIVEIQQGGDGPVITWENIYELFKKFMEITGSKQPELYATDPKTAPPKQPQPDPKMVEAQAKAQEAQQQLQIQHAKNQGDAQLATQKAQADAQLQAQKLQSDHDANMQQMQAEFGLKRELAAAELDLKRQIAAEELSMKRDIAQQELAQQREANQQKADATREHNANMADVAQSKIEAQVRVGGEPG